MNLQQRIELYNKTFPDYPKLTFDKGWISGVWIIGNYYKNESDLYGAYPHSYLKRIMSMFPDCKMVLDLFSGSVHEPNVCSFDINPEHNPTIVGDAHKLSSYFLLERPHDYFDLIRADPPYSDEDANHYGTPMVDRKQVVSECYKILKPGGFLVWLDQVFPMFRKAEFKLVGTIGLVRSTNHRVRIAFIFQKVAGGEENLKREEELWKPTVTGANKPSKECRIS